MASTVKISELPQVSAINGNYRIPAIDDTLTQTSQVSAAQIAGIGGGPPGTNSVQTSSLQDGAVTPVKTGFSAQYKIAVSNGSSVQNSAGTYIGQEVSCSAYIQGLFSASSGSVARAYLDALQSTDDASFTGQTRFPDGTNLAPSITNTGNLNTGFFFPIQNAVGISAEGIEVARHTTSGFRSVSSGYNTLMPHFGVRAWACFTGTASSVLYVTNPHDIGTRAGQGGNSLLADTATVNKLIAIEAANGWTLSSTERASLAALQSAGSGWSKYRDDGRNNYTSPGDNIHRAWNASTNAWYDVAASGNNWIGSIALQASGTTSIKRAGNVTSVTAVSGSPDYYRLSFTEALPSANYAVLATCYEGAYATSYTKTTTHVDIVVRNSSGAITSSQDISVAILL